MPIDKTDLEEGKRAICRSSSVFDVPDAGFHAF